MYREKKIAVVIPAYNEEVHIGNVIDNIPDYVDFIVVVNDASTDRTAKIAKDRGVIVINHNKNRGVGGALKTGISKALKLRVDIMVNIDADEQFNPEDIYKLIDPIINGKADFVTASRFKNKALYPEMSKVKFFGNRLMSFFISKIIKQKFYDVSCGFRAYSYEVLLRLNLFGYFTYTQETFIDLAFKNISICEVPIEVRGERISGNSKGASNLFKYGYNTFKIIFRSYRDYRPLKFFFLISSFFFLIGVLFGGFLLIHYLNTGNFSPHKWSGFTSGFFLIFSLMMLFIGVILDMFVRMRHNQEEMLYLLRRQNYKSKNQGTINT
jgi:glycosyltransferase involved in cell wall biosynthesis